MSEEDPFESPRLLLAGAARHLDALKVRIDQLRATDHWGTPEVDRTSSRSRSLGPISVAVRTNARIPNDMKQIVFDLVNNLRSALDHAVFASTLALTGEERAGTKFPFGDTRTELDGDVKRKCKNVPRQMLDFLLAFEAHRDGNPLLWGLNKLRNTKSHRVLVPFAATVALSGEGEPTPGITPVREWDPSAGRLQVSLDRAPGVEAGGVIYAFRLEVLIGTGTFRGEPALSIFDRMLGEVERVVSAIEAETTRLLESG